MAASPKDKFDAAIKVIHSLPKDGPFQPSKDMMLTFYGYYKQATEGQCTMTKPSFWDLVKKAKWDAWNKLGDMDREEAMDKYVEELKKTLKMCSEKWNEMAKNDDPRIVEAMPQTQAVGDFMEKLGTFYELVDEESPIAGAVMPNGKPVIDPDTISGNEDINMDGMNISQQVEASLQQLSHLSGESEQIRAALSGLSGNGEPAEKGEKSSLSQYSHFDDDEEEEEMVDTGAQGQAGKPPLTNGNGHFEEGTTDTSENRSSSLESTGLLSSDSEDEFCDTSDNPAEVLEVPQTRSALQMSTPLKPGAKTNRVHFADGNHNIPNGKISPIEQKTEHLSMASGFPFINSRVSNVLSDSMVAQTADMTQRTVESESESSEINMSYNNMSYTEDRRSHRQDGGEENEPPDGGSSSGRQSGRPAHREGSTTTGRSGSSRNWSGAPSGRRVLLSGGTGGGAGGGGGDQTQGPAGGSPDTNEQLTLILLRLQQDMTSVLDRLNRLEAQTRQPQTNEQSRRNPRWWPFSSQTGRTAFFILVWPVIVHLLLSFLFRRRRRRT